MLSTTQLLPAVNASFYILFRRTGFYIFELNGNAVAHASIQNWVVLIGPEVMQSHNE